MTEPRLESANQSKRAQKAEPPRCDIGSNSQRPAATTNAVVFWNVVADNSIAVVGGKSPQPGSVVTAMVQTAIYDAVNAICGLPFDPNAVMPDVQIPSTVDAAVAAAAHDVLIALYPAQSTALDQQYSAYLEAIPGHDEGKLNGIAVTTNEFAKVAIGMAATAERIRHKCRKELRRAQDKNHGVTLRTSVRRVNERDGEFSTTVRRLWHERPSQKLAVLREWRCRGAGRKAQCGGV